MRASEFITEKWSAEYKRSINCSNPKGFSQKAHCAGRKKNEGVAEGLSEARNSLFAFVKQQFPSWPDYVLKDFLYQQAKGIRDQAELDDFLKRNKQDFGNCKWSLVKLPITFDIFTPKTQRMLTSREGGSSNPFQVPRDAERHAQQSQMIQQKGVSAEPIIVAKLSNGYDLIEGWHRTIQHLKAFPQGYTGPAWVCTGATYKSESVEQGVAEGFSNDMSTKDMIAYLRQHHDKNLHPDYLNHLTNTNSKFVLKNIPLNSIRTDLSGLDRAKVEQYKKMDFSKAPPIVVGSDGNILDGYHRANVAKALNIPTIKAYVGVKGQKGVAENFADGKVKGKSRPGRVKAAGASCAGSVTDLRAKAKKYSGEKGKMYHWCANMKGGKKK